MRIVTVLGARPQFIKASVVCARLAAMHGVDERIVHTGQHFDENMSVVFFRELGMPEPAIHLGIHGGGHGDMTGRMLIELERVFLGEKPDCVLVYGDTNSTLAGALAAAKLHIPVAHVEAGLRSFNRRMPEEINRVLVDHLSRWLFTPTSAAAEQLAREGVSADKVIPVGDVMHDVALHHGARVTDSGGPLARLSLTRGAYVLATFHRAENTDAADRLAAIVTALARVADELLPIVWPVHPRTRAALGRLGLLEKVAREVHLIDPVGYLDMVQLEKFAALIATDSGGVQKEAFFYRVPCVTVRDETEWRELVDGGWNRLVSPTSAGAVVEAIRSALGTRGADIAPYGQGDAAARIVDRLTR